MIQLDPFANAEEIFVNPERIESITKHKSSYQQTVNQEYYIVAMQNGFCHEITIDSGLKLLRVLKRGIPS